MSSQPMVGAIAGTAVQHRRIPSSSTLRDYWSLTKPEVNFLIVVTTVAGFYAGSVSQSRELSWAALIHAVLGTLLVASGAGSLNQYIERRFDAEMRRTARRPLAAGRVHPSSVLWFGVMLAVVGAAYLALAANLLASFLAIFTLVSYLFAYTPLKRRTPLCTLVGAVPGAMPPLIGWAAACGRLGVEAWSLFAILFLWQFPHFMAIAWMYREDYGRAGYLVLPRGRWRAFVAILQTILPLTLLLFVSMLPLGGSADVVYGTGAFLLS